MTYLSTSKRGVDHEKRNVARLQETARQVFHTSKRVDPDKTHASEMRPVGLYIHVEIAVRVKGKVQTEAGCKKEDE